MHLRISLRRFLGASQQDHLQDLKVCCLLKAIGGVNVDENGVRVPGTLFPGLYSAGFRWPSHSGVCFQKGWIVLICRNMRSPHIHMHTAAWVLWILYLIFSPLSVSFRSLATLFVPSAAWPFTVLLPEESINKASAGMYSPLTFPYNGSSWN